jgi:hypothetical protein
MTTNISSIFLAAIHPARITNELLAYQMQLTHAPWPGNNEATEINNLYYLQAQEKRNYRLKILEQHLRRENIKAVQQKSIPGK